MIKYYGKRMKISTIIIIVTVALGSNQFVQNSSHMGLLERLFGAKSFNQKESIEKDPVIEKSAEMLDESIYWNIVEKSLKYKNNQDDQEEFLIKEIEKLSPKEIIGFRLRTDKFLYDTYNSEMWCAAYIMNGGCSDDGFEYFRNWVISRGKDVFYKAKENPDSLISEYIEGEEFYDFESFWYVALTAFENKTGKELYDYISDDFKTTEGNYPKINFTWKEEKPETMKEICPNLYEKMWN